MLGMGLRSLVKRILPPSSRLWLRIMGVRLSEMPPFGCVRFGSLRRTTPIHSGFDIGRGR